MANAPAQSHSPSAATMGIGFSYPASPPPRKPSSSLNDLHEEILAHVVGFLPARDVEATTVASKRVALEVLPRFPIWKAIFCYRWNMLNYKLERDADGGFTLEIDDRLKALFPSGCTESRMYQLLAHAVTVVPSFVDVRETERASHFSIASHAVEAIGDPPRRDVVDVAYGGGYLGGDRCVRSNEPFASMFRVAVYAVEYDRQRMTKTYRVGITASGYFEISISTRTRASGQRRRRLHGTDMTSIGLGLHSFPLIGKQPGWVRTSIGYHGDDGHLFNRNHHGSAFSRAYGIGDRVGCGVRRDIRTSRSFVSFTNNGDVIPMGDMGVECEHGAWYPVVGLDSMDAVHFNFGQEPFAFEGAVEALFSEAEGESALLASQLHWFDIRESDAESSSDEEHEQDGDRSSSDDADAFEFAYDHIPEFSLFVRRLIDEMPSNSDDDDEVVEEEETRDLDDELEEDHYHSSIGDEAAEDTVNETSD